MAVVRSEDNFYQIGLNLIRRFGLGSVYHLQT
ncbi:hypothetical protein J3A65_004595 [Rhizobium sp. PvP014]|nr:hypothetical protein [Rhizobium sp. PvP014]MBP2531993.1 hypothetical protein [Rhizobium sp. PvP099]